MKWSPWGRPIGCQGSCSLGGKAWWLTLAPRSVSASTQTKHIRRQFRALLLSNFRTARNPTQLYTRIAYRLIACTVKWTVQQNSNSRKSCTYLSIYTTFFLFREWSNGCSWRTYHSAKCYLINMQQQTESKGCSLSVKEIPYYETWQRKLKWQEYLSRNE